VPLTSFQGNLLHQLSNNYVFVVGFWAWFAAQFCKVGAVGPTIVVTPAQVQRCVCGVHTWSAAPADFYKTDKGGCLGHHGNRGLWRHAVIALGIVHGALSMACSICSDYSARRAAAALGLCSAVTQLPLLAILQAVTTAVGHKLGLGSSLFAVSLAFTLVVMYDAANVRWHAGKRNQSCQSCHALCLDTHLWRCFLVLRLRHMAPTCSAVHCLSAAMLASRRSVC
jgi:Divergent PAP2 family